MSTGQLPLPLEAIILPVVRLLRLPQLLPQPVRKLLPQAQPFLYRHQPEFRIWVSVFVLRISALLLRIRSLQPLLSHLRVPGIRLSHIWLSGIRRGGVWGEQNGGSPACARLSRLTARALLPAVQGVSTTKRATHCGRPLDNVGRDGNHTVRLRREGKRAKYAEEYEGSGFRQPHCHEPYHRPYTCKPGASAWANSSAELRGESTQQPDSAFERRATSCIVDDS